MLGNDFRFGKGGLISLWQRKRARFTFLYVLGRASWELPQLSDTHLTTHFDVSLKARFLIDAILIETIVPLSKDLSIVFVRCPRYTTELRSHKTLYCVEGTIY